MPILPPILAHGALGPFDEIIFLGVAAIFLIMMVISWVVNRRSADQAAVDAEAAPSDAEAALADSPQDDRYLLR